MRNTFENRAKRALKKATILFISNLLIAALCAISVNAQTLGGTVFSGDANCGYLKVATNTGLYSTSSETIDIIFTIGANANLANSYGLVGGAASTAINIFLDGNPGGNSRINFNMASGASEFYLRGGGLLQKGVAYHLVAEMDGSYRRMWIGTGTTLSPMELNTIASGNEYGLFSNSTTEPISVIGAFYGTSGAFDGTIASVRVNNNSKEYIGGAALNSPIGNITVSNTLTNVAGSTKFLMTPTTVIPTYAYITSGSYSGTSQTFIAKNDFSAGQTIFLNGVTSPTKTILSATSTQFVVTYGSSPNLTGTNYALSSGVTSDDTGGHPITWPSSLCSTSASAPTQLANYQLSVTQGANGTISPSSTQAVSGSSQTFTFTPSAGYSVASITVDGSALGSSALIDAIANGYTFSSIATSHSVTATYSINTYGITVTQTINGTISPTTASYNYGGSQTFNFAPATGYSVESITVDGSALGSSALIDAIASGYTFSSITTSHTVTATYSINTYGITVTQTSNGTISPGTAIYSYGGSQTFTFTPATGYSVSSITVNGNALTESSAITLASAIASGYTFSAISAVNTITATYAIKTYSVVVTQAADGNISPSTAAYNHGSSQTFTFTPATGYSVSSVTIDSTLLSGSTLTTAISSGYALTTIVAPHTVAAIFAHIEYPVTYDSNTGSGTQASESFTYGSSALALPDSTTFTKTGYNFLGWSDTSTSTTLVATYSTNSAAVFYAVWTPKIYTVSYQSNGGAGSLPLSDTYTVGNAVLTLPLMGSLSKIGNTFTGWSETPTGAVIGLTYTPSATISLQAIWEPILYSVTYDIAGASSTLPTEISHTLYQHFTVASNPTKSGSIFGGWSNGTILFSGGSTYTVSNANVTLTAIWIPLYTLHYILNGSPDTPEGDRLIASGTVVNLAAAPVRHGYEFLNWSDSSSVTYPQLGSFTIVADSTLSAIWTPKHFNVSYSLNGGSGTAPTHATVVIDEIVVLASTPVRTGYTFQGWSDGVSLYAPDAEYVDRGTSLTFTASWSQNSALAISYLGGGGSGAVPLQDSLLEGESLTVASSSSLTYVGFTFTGWNYNVTTYQPGNTIAVGSSPIVLTAQWVRSFSVLYLAGGGSGTAPTRTLDHLTNSVVVVATATSLTKSGYTFTSWSNGVNDFQPGDTFTVLSADVELTATWTIIPIVVASPAPARSEGGAPSAPVVVTVVVVTTEVVTPVEETTSDHMEVTTAPVISTVNDTSGIVVTTTVTPTDLGATKIVALRVKIYFSLSSSTLATKSKTTLNLIAKKALKVGKRFKVKVVGFTQPTKRDPNFKILAKNRAKAVATYLQSKGIKGIYSVLNGGQAPINAPTSRYSVVTVELITG